MGTRKQHGKMHGVALAKTRCYPGPRPRLDREKAIQSSAPALALATPSYQTRGEREAAGSREHKRRKATTSPAAAPSTPARSAIPPQVSRRSNASLRRLFIPPPGSAPRGAAAGDSIGARLLEPGGRKELRPTPSRRALPGLVRPCINLSPSDSLTILVVLTLDDDGLLTFFSPCIFQAYVTKSF